MPLREDPASAQNIISFSGQRGRAAVINYSVPLPSSHTGRRILILEGLGLQADDWTNTAKDTGVAASEQLGLTRVGEGQYTFEQEKAINWWLENAKAAGLPVDQIAELGRWQATPIARRSLIMGPGSFSSRNMGGEPRMAELGGLAEGTTSLTRETDIPPLVDRLRIFLERLRLGIIEKPSKAWGGTYESSGVPADKPQARPALFLVEVCGISSFLGDYGLGRTIKTFTLLPGEQTTIAMKTWRTTTESHPALLIVLIRARLTVFADKCKLKLRTRKRELPTNIGMWRLK